MYKTFAHTADTGLRVEAADLNTLFAAAAQALFSLIVWVCLPNHEQFDDLDSARLSVFKYIETLYNTERIQQTLGDKTPDEYKADYAPAVEPSGTCVSVLSVSHLVSAEEKAAAERESAATLSLWTRNILAGACMKTRIERYWMRPRILDGAKG